MDEFGLSTAPRMRGAAEIFCQQSTKKRKRAIIRREESLEDKQKER
jgi:hypothetical protein